MSDRGFESCSGSVNTDRSRWTCDPDIPQRYEDSIFWEWRDVSSAFSFFPDKLRAVISIIHLLSVTFSSCGRENGLPEGQIKMILRFHSSKERSGARFVCGYTLQISSTLSEVG